jgi:hypothetical protein
MQRLAVPAAIRARATWRMLSAISTASRTGAIRRMLSTTPTQELAIEEMKSAVTTTQRARAVRYVIPRPEPFVGLILSRRQ